MSTPETETKKMTLKLPVPMTVERELDIHREMSNLLKEIAAIEVQKKRITPLRDRVNALNLSIEAQTVEVDVECEEFEDVETGLFKRRRLDTGDIIGTRAMDPDERQLKLGISPEVQAKLDALGVTEEQALAGSPEEAEELRNQRLASEQREREASGEGPRMPRVGDGDVQVMVTGSTEWVDVDVDQATDHNFTATVDGEALIFDESQYGRGWRWKPSWSDVHDATAEIERLAAEQAADAAKDPKPRALLKAPKKNGKAKRISVVDQDDKPIPPAEEVPEPLPEADELCAPDCEKPHICTIERTAF